ncbi:cytochrome P450 [Parathielavia hyrcaniae]|uniref:Cytochrome P450 n=1 Tax=Parathielavia hyrcaniae TaxID=113614 RepID=A0AAN6PW12_9PEZI|nr:cytochrome P450 [Parathielavia hyrcaniae]
MGRLIPCHLGVASVRYTTSGLSTRLGPDRIVADAQLGYEAISAKLPLLLLFFVHRQAFTVVVVPPKFLVEFRNLPEDVLSPNDSFAKAMHVKYIGIMNAAGQVVFPHTVKTSLTPALARLNPLIAEEVKVSIHGALPPCHDWTPININNTVQRIVAQVFGRIFIGAELSRSEEYLDAAVNYTVRALDQVRPWLRPILAWKLPEVKKIGQRLAQADKLLRPVVAARQRIKDDSEKPDDMLQWLMDGQDKFKHYTTEVLARIQLGITFVAVRTTSALLTNVFHNLAAYPQYVPELRDEIRAALAEHNGVFNNPAMHTMKKLDSFFKETSRLYPSGFMAFQRQVNKSFTLSNGEVIPAGVVIQVPVAAISRDSDVFADPDQLDPWRFSRLRAEAAIEDDARHQLVTLNPDIMLIRFLSSRGQTDWASGWDLSTFFLADALPSTVRLWVACVPRSFLHCQRDEDDCGQAASGLRHQAPGRRPGEVPESLDRAELVTFPTQRKTCSSGVVRTLRRGPN